MSPERVIFRVEAVEGMFASKVAPDDVHSLIAECGESDPWDGDTRFGNVGSGTHVWAWFVSHSAAQNIWFVISISDPYSPLKE